MVAPGTEPLARRRASPLRRTYTHVIPQPNAGRQVIMTRLHAYVSFRRLCQSPLSDLYHGPNLDRVNCPAKRCPSVEQRLVAHG